MMNVLNLANKRKNSAEIRGNRLQNKNIGSERVEEKISDGERTVNPDHLLNGMTELKKKAAYHVGIKVVSLSSQVAVSILS